MKKTFLRGALLVLALSISLVALISCDGGKEEETLPYETENYDGWSPIWTP